MSYHEKIISNDIFGPNNLSVGFRKIAFISDEQFGGRLRTDIFQFLKPPSDVPEALFRRHVKHDDDAIDSPEQKRHRRKCPVFLLAGSVPTMNFDPMDTGRCEKEEMR